MHRTYHKTLSNGFRIVTIEMPHLHSIRVSLFIHVGSRFETRKTNGLTHLLEHMFFRGTKKYPSILALNNAIEEMGSDMTGTTRREDCSFWFDIHPKFISRGLDIFSDIFLNPLFKTKDLEVEKKIVIAESLEDVDEEGSDTDVDNASCKLLWKGTPLGFKIIGESKKIMKYTRDDLLRHYETYYVPNNMVLCVAGQVDHREVERKIIPKFKKLKQQFVFSPEPAKKDQEEPRTLFISHDWNQVNLKFSFRAFSYHDPFLFPLTILDDIVGSGISSRLNLNICEQMGLAYFVSSSLDCFSDDGSFDLDVTVKGGDTVKGVQAILKEVQKLKRNGITAQELKKSKERYICDLEKDKDSPARMCIRYGMWELKGNSFTLEKEKKLIQQIGLRHMKELIDHLFQPKNLNFVALGGFSKAEEWEVKKLIEHY